MQKRILIADDDAGILLFLKELLCEEGYEVDTAQNGLLAWKMLITQQRSYDLLLIDGWMPDLSGLELLQLLHWQKSMPIPPTIVLSSDKNVLQQASSMHIPYTMEKPFELDDLLGLLASVLQAQMARTDSGHMETFHCSETMAASSTCPVHGKMVHYLTKQDVSVDREEDENEIQWSGNR